MHFQEIRLGIGQVTHRNRYGKRNAGLAAPINFPLWKPDFIILEEDARNRNTSAAEQADSEHKI